MVCCELRHAALAITASPAGELLSVSDAKQHLRLMSGDWDAEITAKVRAARDYCERYTQRTLRAAVTRTLKTGDWWSCALHLPWPPLLASPAPTIAYYDAANDSQSLAAANYHVETSTDGGGRIVWDDDMTFPDVFERPDAVTVTFTTGYADATALPPVAIEAMKTKLTELWGAGTEGEVKAARECTDRLLGMVDWTGYA